MNETINIVRLRQPDEIDDPLTDVLRTGARKLLAQAIERLCRKPFGKRTMTWNAPQLWRST
ncbi:hypothetical protein [Mesorhizobium jarvisii]|uniref:hypothetical protein n=1 Tax=Mesorhizobium jarvisii TaxID=1777867 RepID=UPI001F0B5F59|nr:hypothetical protein [Mesorhizobium jarvisii]MCH4561491.1 hypothetical protein [Mesorhizobium jarvisii]